MQMDQRGSTLYRMRRSGINDESQRGFIRHDTAGRLDIQRDLNALESIQSVQGRSLCGKEEFCTIHAWEQGLALHKDVDECHFTRVNFPRSWLQAEPVVLGRGGGCISTSRIACRPVQRLSPRIGNCEYLICISSRPIRRLERQYRR